MVWASPRTKITALLRCGPDRYVAVPPLPLLGGVLLLRVPYLAHVELGVTLNVVEEVVDDAVGLGEEARGDGCPGGEGDGGEDGLGPMGGRAGGGFSDERLLVRKLIGEILKVS